jgi:hypothetical protein
MRSGSHPPYVYLHPLKGFDEVGRRLLSKLTACGSGKFTRAADDDGGPQNLERCNFTGPPGQPSYGFATSGRAGEQLSIPVGKKHNAQNGKVLRVVCFCRFSREQCKHTQQDGKDGSSAGAGQAPCSTH